MSSTGDISVLADLHAFLYERVKLFIRILFFYFAVFSVFGIVKAYYLVPRFEPDFVQETVIGNLIMGVLTVATGAGWLYLRRQRRPMMVLHHIESGGTILACAMTASMARLVPEAIPQVGLLMMMVLILVVRAAIVPSTAFRTLVVGLVASGILASLIALNPTADPDDIFAQYMPGIAMGWGVIFTITTVIVSRVIYGLQQKVREAMQLGNYTLIRKLGEGGMGMVYLARHALLSRPTAIKLLPPEKAGQQNVARFEREVQRTSQLAHPNTVRIYDYGHTPDGIFYYAMEYLDGLNLEELVAFEGPQPPGRVIFTLAQVAHALSEAHDAGLIHRDIKPANIVLCNRGGAADTAKVLDFGLIKDIQAPSELALSSTDAITGTPQYLAPELLTAPAGVDRRADIYSLGAVGYFVLTGRHVFDGETVVEVCSHHLHTAPRPPSERLGRPLPDDLESVLLRCLEKKPDDRFDGGNALRAALLSCRDADVWGLDQASEWWSRNEGRVAAYLAEKAPSVQEESPQPECGFLQKSLAGVRFA
jgi:serine/threonine-protein kinase